MLASVDELLSPVVVLVASVVLVSSTDDEVELSSVVELSLVGLPPLAPVDEAVAVTVRAETAAAPITASHLARVCTRSDCLDVIGFPPVADHARGAAERSVCTRAVRR